jgi:uncharacterized repeat protein (TIGR03943 family)
VISEARSVLLLLFGGALLRISLSDVYLRYVKAGVRPLLIAAGAVLVVIALVTLFRELFARTHEAGHEHNHGGVVAWLLVLPVLAIFLVGPPALGSYAAGRTGTAVAAKSEYPPLPAGNPVPVTLLDYGSRAIWDAGLSLTGRHVELTGFTSPRPGGGMYLTRMVLTCCAADARPIKIAMRGDAPTGLAANTWIQVTGTYEPGQETDPVNHEPIPFVSVTAAKPIPAPTEVYE